MSVNVYIVDDDYQMSEMLRAAVEDNGLRARVFNNALYFLAENTGDSDIILLDLNMPDMDGIEMIRVLAGKQCKSSLILISGHDVSVLHSAEELARAHSLNVVMSLCKPIELRILQQLLKSVMKKKCPGYVAANSASAELTAAELGNAIRQNELVLHYQPQVDMKDGTLVGAEALVRWQHPDHGLIYPDRFIGLAERSGQVDELTYWVIDHAIQQSSKCQELCMQPRVSVNISAGSISSLVLPDHLTDVLMSNRLDPSVLAMEITESSLMGELVTSLDVLTRLRMKGFDLSIDDFGTGHSSLTQLHKVPFTELKIDKSFVTHMDVDEDAAAIVKTCVMLGHELKMTVVGEGVETKPVYDMLAAYGCDVCQGYYIARPMPPDEFNAWATSR